MSKKTLSLLASSILFFSIPQTVFAGFSVTELNPNGATNYGAVSINNKGQAIGAYAIPPQSSNIHSILWQNGISTDLGSLGGTQTEAWMINNKSQVVGQSLVSNEIHAFLWEDGTMKDIQALGIGSEATGINDKGDVVGMIYYPGNVFHAFFLPKNGVMQDIGTLGGTFSHAFSINNQRQIVGVSSTSHNNNHAFLWQNGTMIDLGTLGGDTSHAKSINDKGQIVGISSDTNGVYHAFLWQNNNMLDLGVGDATDINNSGDIVGTSYDATLGTSSASLWHDGVLTPLSVPNAVQGNAYGINDKGQIVGSVKKSTDSLYHPVIWTPDDL